MKTPVVSFAFANERTEKGFLRNLTLEMKLLLRALEPVAKEGKVYLHLIPSATTDEIQDLFQDSWFEGRVSIFHYGGHATSDKLWLENNTGGNESFFAEGLARFLGAQQGLNLVFLNACSTSSQARRLIEQNIPAVIATSRDIPDELATAFADAFYRGLASGASIEESFQEADGLMIGRKGKDAFRSNGTRSLYWDDEPGIGELDLPWKLYLKQEASWFPAQWRLVHVAKEAEPSQALQQALSLEGKVVARHLIYENLGYGALGVMWRAQQMTLQQDRAMKITYDIESGFESLEQSMQDGFMAMKKLDHPNIAKVLEMGRIEMPEDPTRYRLYFSMELLKGNRLDSVDWKGDADQVIGLAMDLCQGLHAAHTIEYIDTSGSRQVGIVHGNLMTKKIFLDEFNNARIIDFLFTNLSRLPEVKLRLPLEAENKLRQQKLQEYFAPELLAGDANVNVLADIYSVGSILLEVYTGKTIDKWSFSSEKDLFAQIQSQFGSASAELVRAIFVATLPNPEERWQSAAELNDYLAPSISWWRKFVRKISR